MKKSLILAAAAIAALSACNKENIDTPEVVNAPVFTATIEGSTTKTQLVEGSKAGQKKVNWENTDKVSINGATYAVTPGASDASKATLAYESGTAPTSTYKAYYPASMYNAGTETLPASYTYAAGKFNMPMYAQSTTTELGFQNICGVLAIKVTSAEMAKVTKITVSSDKAISGTCTIKATDGKYAATAKGTADADKTVTLDCGAEGVTPTAEGTIFYLPVPVISGAKLYISVAGTINSTKAASYAPFLYRQAMNANSVTVERNKIYNIDFKTSLAKFSVAESKTVNFTQGNLYWDGSAFKFENSQTAYPTTLDANHIGHFFWSKTASVMYANKYSDSEASESDKFFFDYANRNNEANKVDGTSGLYALSGGSGGEWDYLINSRSNKSLLCKKAVSVTTSAGTAENCLIIAPDGYDYLAHPLQASYTSGEWAAAEAFGLVCLPAAGYRTSSVSKASTNGYCWSSSRDASGAGYLNFSSTSINTANTSECKYGRSLRLVK